MRQAIKPLLTIATLAVLVSGCVAYVPSRHWGGVHGHRHHQGCGHGRHGGWDDDDSDDDSYDRWRGRRYR